MCQIQSIHSSPRRTPAAEAAVPGGWIDLTREGFCYAKIVGILSFSVVAQSLVNWPYGVVPPVTVLCCQRRIIPERKRDKLKCRASMGVLCVFIHAIEGHHLINLNGKMGKHLVNCAGGVHL